jgi:ATPase subunit of ABC transporter with duplicated ATPase domains
MLTANDVSKTYDGRVILNNINLTLNEREIVGLVGSNGVGKSTLLKILAGEEQPDTGVIYRNNDIIGYLPQDEDISNVSIREFFLNKDIVKGFEYKVDMNLERVGLSDLDMNMNCGNLSGGQKTRLYIAAQLLQDPEPTVLILDEPTNNLDIAGLEWLEGFIRDFDGTVLLTSHDRYFLDKVVTRIVELDKGELRSFGGNYTFYKEQVSIEKEAQLRMYTSQQTKINRIIEDIHEYKQKALHGEHKYTSRDPYQKKKASKAARTAIVRQKKLEKMLSGEDLVQKPELRRSKDLPFEGGNPEGKKVCEVINITKSFDNHLVLNAVTFAVFGKERLWIKGPNGSGKSTLLNILTGKETQDKGEVKIGSNIKVAYFSQELNVNPEITGIEELMSTGADATSCFISADHMHLVENDLRKKLKHLSRGQIAKIEIIKLLLGEFNLLVLDEPTNHLEIETREDIENALKQYKGAMIVASHDRYFIEQIGISTVFELKKNH